MVYSNQRAALRNGPHVYGSYVNGGGYSVKGMYLGTSDKADAESHPDNYLFLPYTGRSTSYYPVTIVKVGETGCYMNTYYGGAGILANWLLGVGYFGGGSPEDVGSVGYQNDYGGSIRCVKIAD